MITIKANDARLSILGYQPEVKSIFWSHLPTHLPTYGQPLDLTGSEITAVYVNGETAVVTDYCTFSPAEGATVPNEATMTVTAVYTARSGKIVKADALLPIAIPAYIRVIVPNEVEPAKPWEFYTEYNGVDTGIDWREAWGWTKIKTYLYWTRLDEVVRIQEIEPTYSTPGDYFYVHNFGPGTLSLGIRSVEDATYNRYITPTQYREVEARAIKIRATYTIYGITLVDEPYLEINEVDTLELINRPLTCSTSEYSIVTLTLNNIRTKFKNHETIDAWHWPYQANSPRYIPSSMGIYDSINITIGMTASDSFKLLLPLDTGGITAEYSYSCENGVVYWTDPDDE